MDDSDIIVPEIYVQPGELHLSREPVIFRTVLGSCVGVTFLAPQRGVGAICHPMLPVMPHRHGAHKLSVAHARRYVDYAIHDMLGQFDALSVHREEIQVKLFGGGDVLLVSNETTRPTVGRMNYETALRVLSEEGLEVSAQSLGGLTGLSIQFHTGTGEVLLRRLNSMEQSLKKRK